MTDATIHELNPRVAQRVVTGVNFAGTGEAYTAARSDHFHYLVLGPSDPIPPGTPAGTLIFRTP
jgi:hypothetical protein